jgi:GNAT superfamily N-acetyltransferase
MIDRHSRIQITVEPDPEAFEAQLEERLLASLRRNVPASDYAPLGVLARDAGGRIVGGLSGGTSYGWLLVRILWVAEELRGHGLGVRIMALAEEEARRRGCHGVWLDTSSARARGFYERLGFEVFGMLENRDGERPQGHARFFLSKRLSPPRGTARGDGPRTG